MSKSLSGVMSCRAAAPASSVLRQSDGRSPEGATGLSRRLVVGVGIGAAYPGRRGSARGARAPGGVDRGVGHRRGVPGPAVAAGGGGGDAPAMPSYGDCRSIEIDAPPDVCFDVMSDVERMSDWQRAVCDVEILERDADGR